MSQSIVRVCSLSTNIVISNLISVLIASKSFYLDEVASTSDVQSNSDVMLVL